MFYIIVILLFILWADIWIRAYVFCSFSLDIQLIATHSSGDPSDRSYIINWFPISGIGIFHRLKIPVYRDNPLYVLLFSYLSSK